MGFLSRHCMFSIRQCIALMSYIVSSEADNCPRENKNQYMLKMLSWMLLQKGLELTGLFFHRVGHTHAHLGYFARLSILQLFDHLDNSSLCDQDRIPCLFGLQLLDQFDHSGLYDRDSTMLLFQMQLFDQFDNSSFCHQDRILCL